MVHRGQVYLNPFVRKMSGWYGRSWTSRPMIVWEGRDGYVEGSCISRPS